MEVRKIPMPYKNQDSCEILFEKKYGLLGKIVLEALKKNCEIPKDYTGRTQEYYIKIATGIIKQMQNGFTRSVLTTMIKNKMPTKKIGTIARDIMNFLFESS